MSTKHVRTTGDLVRFGLNLSIECATCGSTNVMTSAEVVKLAGLSDLEKVRKRLRCSECGKRAAKIWWL